MDLRPPQTVLSFKAHLVSKNREDILRQFIVNFFVDDDKFSVFECVVPNTGFPGGQFIARSRFVNPDTNAPFKTTELYIDSEIVLNGWRFHLDEATEGTLRAMEANPDLYPKSDLSTTLIPAISKLKPMKGELEKQFKAKDKAGHGRVSFAIARNIFDDLDIATGKQERITLFRRFQFADAEQFKYEDFLSLIQ